MKCPNNIGFINKEYTPRGIPVFTLVQYKSINNFFKREQVKGDFYMMSELIRIVRKGVIKAPHSIYLIENPTCCLFWIERVYR
jgi:hypothetical protein